MPAPSAADRKALEAILERATIDREFRQQLLTDWRGAIQQEFGIVIPPAYSMRFVERDPDVAALIVLPDFKNADGELSDHDLESIAGGVTPHDVAPW